jgi:hypothetical protein
MHTHRAAVDGVTRVTQDAATSSAAGHCAQSTGLQGSRTSTTKARDNASESPRAREGHDMTRRRHSQRMSNSPMRSCRDSVSRTHIARVRGYINISCVMHIRSCSHLLLICLFRSPSDVLCVVRDQVDYAIDNKLANFVVESHMKAREHNSDPPSHAQGRGQRSTCGHSPRKTEA